MESHTGGAVYGFTPNMTQEQITELDKRRGLGDQGAFNDPDILINKRPWLKPDGTHKSEGAMSKTAEAIQMLKAVRMPEGEPFAKPALPSEGKAMDEKDDVRLLEQVLDHEKEEVQEEGKSASRLDIGQSHRAKQRAMGRKERQNIMRPARVAKSKEEADDNMRNFFDDDKDETDKGMMPGMPQQPSMAPKPPMASTAAPPSMGAGVGPSMGIGKGDDIGDKLFDKSTSTMKALNSRSFFIPPPLQPYDPFNVMRQATTIPVSKGDIGESSMPVRLGEMEKSCAVHGIQYRPATGCGPCNVIKSMSCIKCGSPMAKGKGGMMSCPRGH